VAPEHGAGAVKQKTGDRSQKEPETRKSKFETRCAQRHPSECGVNEVEDCHPSAGSGQGFRGDDPLRSSSNFGFRFSNFDLRASILSSDS
jgi:hypothetical protein